MNAKRKVLLDQLYAMESSQDYPISNPEAAVVKLLPLRKRKVEIFVALLLDNKNNLLAKRTVSKGTVDQSAVYPREIFRAAIMAQASGVILGHNHPGGDPAPSVHDREVTKAIIEGGKLLGIRILDHIIISRSGHYSFQENGQI